MAFIDRKEWLWNTSIDNVMISSAEFISKKLNNDDNINIFIASFSFIDDIKKSINKIFNNVKENI